MNHMLSFCRITLASRIFKRNNYFPLFRVLTPKDARKTLLSKPEGPRERYIPVLMNHKRRENLSKGKRVKLAVGYGKRPHKIDKNFRYVSLKWDNDNDKHKRILSSLKSKRKLKGKFIYGIIEREIGLVVTGQMEDALRDGDICDMMVSNFSDKVIVWTKSGDKVTVGIEDWEGPMQFLEGEGATSKDTEDNKHHYGKVTMGLAQIYEMKEKETDDYVLEGLRLAAKKKAKLAALVKKEMKVVLDNLDYADDFDDEKEMKKTKAKAAGKPVDEEKEEQLEDLISDKSTQINVKNMEHTSNVSEKLLEDGIHTIERLPKLTEINDIVKSMSEGKAETVADVSGMCVVVERNERFLVGQVVNTTNGEVFVPGQTINTDEGPKYMTGITVNIDDNPTLFGGLVMANDFGEAVFLPGQAVITEDGHLQLGGEDNPIQPTGMQTMDIKLDVHDVTEEDKERKIARKLKVEKERKEKEEKKMEEESREWKRIAAEKKAQEDTEWAEAEREKQEKEREENEEEERLRLRKEREEVERKEAMKEEEERQKKDAASKEAQEKQATEDAKHEARLKELAESLPKEIVVDEEVEKENVDLKKAFMKEEQQRMSRIRELNRKPIKKIVIPQIEKYEPLPPVVISEKLQELQELIQKGNFFNDHQKFLPTLTLKQKVQRRKNMLPNVLTNSNISHQKRS